MFRCLLVVLLFFFFWLYCVTTVTPSRSLREEKEVSLLSWGWKDLQKTWISTKRRHFCCDWSRTLPDRGKWPGLNSSYEGSNTGYAIKPKQKTVKRQADTEKQWNASHAGKSFLFISLKEKSDFTLFSVQRSQYFISHTKSLILNGRHWVAYNATPARPAERSRVTYGK